MGSKLLWREAIAEATRINSFALTEVAKRGSLSQNLQKEHEILFPLIRIIVFKYLTLLYKASDIFCIPPNHQIEKTPNLLRIRAKDNKLRMHLLSFVIWVGNNKGTKFFRKKGSYWEDWRVMLWRSTNTAIWRIGNGRSYLVYVSGLDI